MRYQHLVYIVAHEAKVDYDTADRVLKGFVDTVKEVVLENGDSVGIPKFGRFWPRSVKERTSQKIGDHVVDIPPQTKVAFRVSDSAIKMDDERSRS